jgi:hypothetical protein
MKTIVASLGYAFVNLLHPRMLWLLVWPMLVSLLVWGIAAVALWTRTALWIAEHLREWAASGVFLIRFDFGDWALFFAHLIVFFLWAPLVYLTALLILSVFGVQKIVEHVAARRFPQLARRRGGSAGGSAWNGVVALLGTFLLAVVTLPLWILPPLWPAISVAILGWVNQRALRYDALSEHATAEEMRALFAVNRGKLYLLGVISALLAFLGPALSGLAFVHFLLADLERRRGAPVDGESRVIDA